MNNIYFLGKIIEISKIKFDYYNKLKASLKINILDSDNNEIFNIDVLEKDCDYINFNCKVNDIVLLQCNIQNINGNYKYILVDIEK